MSSKDLNSKQRFLDILNWMPIGQKALDALEADMEGYVEAAKEARGNNNREDVKTFTEAAERILALKGKLEALLGE